MKLIAKASIAMALVLLWVSNGFEQGQYHTSASKADERTFDGN